jgi:hypothetical protein
MHQGTTLNKEENYFLMLTNFFNFIFSCYGAVLVNFLEQIEATLVRAQFDAFPDGVCSFTSFFIGDILAFFDNFLCLLLVAVGGEYKINFAQKNIW